jgi:hypothetical protein
MAARKAPAKKVSGPVDLHGLGARVVSVFGPFNSRVLIEMPAEAAEPMFPDGLGASGRVHVVEAAMREVEAIRERDEELAGSALSASAVALAYEIEHPFNSATSKSMCAREMRDTLDRLRELMPPEEKPDAISDIEAQRAKRLARVAAAADLPGS